MHVLSFLAQFWQGLTLTALVTLLGAVAMYPFRKVKSAYNDLKTLAQETRDELATQRTNCLQTLQNDGKTQIEILGKVADTLTDIKVELAAQTGFLQASSGSPRRSRSKK